MMNQIRNEIKFHNHEDVEAELAKIQHNNKKMGLELKGLREDNQYISTRMQKLRICGITQEKNWQPRRKYKRR